MSLYRKADVTPVTQSVTKHEPVTIIGAPPVTRRTNAQRQKDYRERLKAKRGSEKTETEGQ